jgi:hypothetical protein
MQSFVHIFLLNKCWIYNLYQIKTFPTQAQLRTNPTQDQLKTTPSQDQLNSSPTQDQIKTPTKMDHLNFTATQEQLAVFNPISEEKFPFKYKPRTYWNENDSDVDYSDDEEMIDDLMRKLELRYQIT